MSKQLEEACDCVLALWREQHGVLTRQAFFFDAAGNVKVCAFPDPGSREHCLQQLFEATDRAPGTQRVWFFYASAATAPDGTQLDVIIVEVADLVGQRYWQAVYSAVPEPELLATNEATLFDSPLAPVCG